MSSLRTIKWQLLIVASLGTMVLLYTADILFVAYYAYFMNPGQDQAFYSQFAQDTAPPFIFCFAPFPIYIISRWLGSKAGRAFYLHAALYIVVYQILDLSLVAFTHLGALLTFIAPAYLVILLAKLGAALVGAHFARKQVMDMQPA